MPRRPPTADAGSVTFLPDGVTAVQAAAAVGVAVTARPPWEMALSAPTLAAHGLPARELSGSG